jgi:hypothetical protein
MFRYIIVYKYDTDIWWSINGVSYPDALKETLKNNIDYFNIAFENYLDDQEIIKRGYVYDSLRDEDVEVFYPTEEQLNKALTFHMDIFQDIGEYIIFQINFITGSILQLERQDLV